METWILIFGVANLLGLGALGLFARKYLPAYTSEKGKNLATKEDIAEITRLLESAKAEITSRIGINQFRYEREFEMLAALSQHLSTVERALGPIVGVERVESPSSPSQNFDAFFDAASELHAFIAPRRAFLSRDVAAAVDTLSQRLNQHAWSALMKAPGEVPITEIEEIQRVCAHVMETIGKRAREWEKFDAPG